MPRPIISYAPATHHGVTTLMAVGKDEDPEGRAIHFHLGRAIVMGVAGRLVHKNKGAAAGILASILYDFYDAFRK